MHMKHLLILYSLVRAKLSVGGRQRRKHSTRRRRQQQRTSATYYIYVQSGPIFLFPQRLICRWPRVFSVSANMCFFVLVTDNFIVFPLREA